MKYLTVSESQDVCGAGVDILRDGYILLRVQRVQAGPPGRHLGHPHLPHPTHKERQGTETLVMI